MEMHEQQKKSLLRDSLRQRSEDELSQAVKEQ